MYRIQSFSFAFLLLFYYNLKFVFYTCQGLYIDFRYSCLKKVSALKITIDGKYSPKCVSYLQLSVYRKLLNRCSLYLSPVLRRLNVGMQPNIFQIKNWRSSSYLDLNFANLKWYQNIILSIRISYWVSKYLYVMQSYFSFVGWKHSSCFELSTKSEAFK